MKKRLSLVCLALLLAAVLPLGALAAWDPTQEGIAISSAAVYLENLETGTVVYEQNADAVRSPASLTKMMTCLLLLESGVDLDTMVEIPERMAGELDHILEENGMDVGLKVGERITLRNLLYSALLPSANDAASAIADYLTDGDLEAFVAQMNQRAAELGCTDTRFNCTHGLYESTDGGNWSTARDMAKIAKACWERADLMEVACTVEGWLPISNLHPEPKAYTDGTLVPEGYWLKLSNSNLMLDPSYSCYRSYIRGIKTGFTDLAGRCLATVAETDQGTYLLVELGCPNQRTAEGSQLIYDEIAALLDWTTERFAVGEAVTQGQLLLSLPVLDSPDGETAALCAETSLTALLDDGGVEVVGLDLPEAIQAPASAGDVVGHASVLVNGCEAGQVALVLEQDYGYSLWLHLKNQASALWDRLFAA